MKPISNKRQSQECEIQIVHPRGGLEAADGKRFWSLNSQLEYPGWAGGCIITPFTDTVWNHRHNKSRERALEIEREIRTSLNSVSASIKFKGAGESSRGYWASVNTSKHAPSYRFIFQFKKIGQAEKRLFLITETGEQRRTSQEAS